MATFPKVKIKDHCEITSSKRIFADEYLSAGVPFYRGKEISQKQKSSSEVSDLIYISREKFEEIKSKYEVPQKGDILLTSVGTIGNPYLVKENEEFYFKDGNLTWFKNFQGVNGQWLYYWLLSPQGKSELNKCTIGSSQKAYTINLLYGLQIELPDLKTQIHIASALSIYDDLIENNERRIKALEDMAHLLYTEWFVRFKFNNYKKVKMVDSGTEYGVIPEGWDVKSLRELTSVITKGTTPTTLKKSFVKNGVNFIKIQSIGNKGEILEDKLAKIDQETHELLNRSRLQNGDVLFSIAGAIGRTTRMIPRFLPANTNQALAILRPKEEAYGIYLYQVISSLNFLNFSKGRIVQTAQANVSLSVLASAQILLPDRKILNAYYKKVSLIFGMIDTIRSQTRILEKTRDLLIPQLITGKRELKNADKKAPEKKEVFRDAVIFSYYINMASTATFHPTHIRAVKNIYFADRFVGVDPTKKYAEQRFGPYSPKSTYAGGEKIALGKKYVQRIKGGFKPGEKISEIKKYTYQELGAVDKVLSLLKFKKDDELELLATIDFTIYKKLLSKEKPTANSVFDYIKSSEIWKEKVDRLQLSLENINTAMVTLRELAKNGLQYPTNL